MLYINNSTSPYSEQKVSLGGQVFTLVFKFNIRNNCWYLSVFDSTGVNPVIKGIQLKPNQPLTERYDSFNVDGDLWCIRVKSDSTDITYSNLGKGKTYRLAWLSSQESSTLKDVIKRGILNV